MTSPTRRALLVRSGARTCALAIEHVVETLRPLPAEPLVGVASFVRGVTVVRGEPMPVVDLAHFLTGSTSDRAHRYVVLRCGARRAVLAVDEVIGVGEAGGDAPAPLLAAACGASVTALAAADRDLLLVLEAGRIVPDEAWGAVPGPERPT